MQKPRPFARITALLSPNTPIFCPFTVNGRYSCPAHNLTDSLTTPGIWSAGVQFTGSGGTAICSAARFSVAGKSYAIVRAGATSFSTTGTIGWVGCGACVGARVGAWAGRRVRVAAGGFVGAAVACHSAVGVTWRAATAVGVRAGRRAVAGAGRDGKSDHAKNTSANTTSTAPNTSIAYRKKRRRSN